MGKIDDKKKQKKAALLSAAYQLFAVKGIDNTSVSEIVQGAIAFIERFCHFP